MADSLVEQRIGTFRGNRLEYAYLFAKMCPEDNTGSGRVTRGKATTWGLDSYWVAPQRAYM